MEDAQDLDCVALDAIPDEVGVLRNDDLACPLHAPDSTGVRKHRQVVHGRAQAVLDGVCCRGVFGADVSARASRSSSALKYHASFTCGDPSPVAQRGP